MTGERRALPTELVEEVRSLRRDLELPVAVGFGISTPEQVSAVAAVADGVVVGSALVRRIAESGSAQEMIADLGEFAGTLARATARRQRR